MNTSLNIAENQLQKLKEIFPEVFVDGNKVDWDKLRLTLGESIDTSKESFGMNWPGKSDCFKTIQQPSIATLVPDREESINFDTSENIFIEGDNLEVLKLLQKNYFGKVKMIYLDPPSNTVEEKDVRSDSKWLNMMYPRLFLARNLLKEDGVIFISIAVDGLSNLLPLTNEIFGKENRAGICVRKTTTGSGRKGKFFSSNVEYILVYSKDVSKVEGFKIDTDEEQRKKLCPKIETNASIQIDKNGANYKWNICKKIWLNDRSCESKTPNDLLLKFENTHSFNVLRKIDIPFTNAKPLDLISHLIKIAGVKNNDIILDLEEGSATIAHSVLEINKKYGIRSKFICVQLPKPTKKTSFAFKAGYKTIAEVSKERIRRVIQKIINEQAVKGKDKLFGNQQEENINHKQDLGFKVFKLTS